jgi:hypothetical protein
MHYCLPGRDGRAVWFPRAGRSSTASTGEPGIIFCSHVTVQCQCLGYLRYWLYDLLYSIQYNAIPDNSCFVCQQKKTCFTSTVQTASFGGAGEERRNIDHSSTTIEHSRSGMRGNGNPSLSMANRASRRGHIGQLNQFADDLDHSETWPELQCLFL